MSIIHMVYKEKSSKTSQVILMQVILMQVILMSAFCQSFKFTTGEMMPMESSNLARQIRGQKIRKEARGQKIRKEARDQR